MIDEYPDALLSFKEYSSERGARLLFIVRNPDHVVDSLINRGTNSQARATYRWAQGTRELYKAHREIKDTYVVEFESLVKDPKSQLARIFDYVGLNNDPDIIGNFSSTLKYDTEKIDPSVTQRDVKNYNIRKRFRLEYDMYEYMKNNSY